MKNFAIIGNPVSHSLSPYIHKQFAKQINLTISYIKIQSTELSFKKDINNFFYNGGTGINITSPFKKMAYKLANIVTNRCRKIKSANVLWMQNNKIYADNTDGIGFIRDFNKHYSIIGKKILILGSGGTVNSIIVYLSKFDIHKPIYIGSRNIKTLKYLEKNFPDIKCCMIEETVNFLPYHIIINATSSSLLGNSLFIPKIIIHNKPFVYELSYLSNNTNTNFLKYCLINNCISINGLGMLIEQAAETFYVWHGIQPNITPILNKLSHYNSDLE